MIRITVEEAQRNFATYLQRVRTGEVVTLVDGQQPIAEIKSVPAVRQQRRPLGLCLDEFVVPEDFDAPLPEKIVAEFEGG